MSRKFTAAPGPAPASPPESVPVARLPVETLLAIFSHLPAVDPFPGWAAVTQVCKHWRRIALNFPSLWTQIPLAKDACAQRALKLSRDLPIRVVSPSADRQVDAAAVGSILRHIQRIEVLDLHPNAYHLTKEDITKLGRSSAPSLRYLRLSFPQLSSSDARWCSPLPQVTHRLTTLCLSHSFNDPVPIWPNAAELIRTFNDMPALKYIELLHVLPLEMQAPGQEERQRHELPQALEALKVCDAFSSVAALFGHYMIPSGDVEVKVDCFAVPERSEASLSEGLQLLYGSYSASGRTRAIRDILIRTTDVHDEDVSPEEQQLDLGHTVSRALDISLVESKGRGLHLTLRWESLHSAVTSMETCIEHLGTFLDLSDVKAFTADYDNEVWGQLLRPLFNSMNDLEVLYLCGHAFKGSGSFGSSLPSLLCSRLQSVTLHSVHLTDFPGHPPLNLRSRISTMLGRRRDCGSPLKLLKLVNCDLLAGMPGAIATDVIAGGGTFEWDRHFDYDCNNELDHRDRIERIWSEIHRHQ
ncbi:hypothetical protein BC834DRAFT_113384 [Gloeopeniophorella convolvens]|nr:hypothetical protein BC834DRAFT_113384 [Gloeopeniophorella convolvens]